MNQPLIVEIYQHWDSSHDRTGQLIHRFDGFWHYGVALCNTVGLSWGPCEPGKSYALGQLVVHSLTDFSDAKWVKTYLRKDLVLENLIASVDAFHHKWNYGFQGWNCEHWARLVTTNSPKCYQTQNAVLGLFDVFGGSGTHPTAKKYLESFKDQNF